MVSEMDNARGHRMPRSARRAQLLEAAQAAFVEQGYHAAAMDDIAVRAGVSKPVLYQHFPGKQELYLALLDQHTAALESLVVEAIASTTDNKQRVLATIAAYYDFIATEGAPFRLIFESDLTNEPAVAERLEGMLGRIAEAVADVVQQDAAMSRAEALLIGTALTGMAQVSARQWISQGGALTQEDAARLVGQLAWRGIGGFPKSS